MLPQPPTATLLVNHAARGVAKRIPDPDRVIRYLAIRGVQTRLILPSSAEEATSEARASAERGDELLFVAGGDGSVRDAALGLAGSDTALAALPAGTVNIWAKESGLPRSIRGALDAHLKGQRVRVDLGRAGDQCFLLMASAGWDAEVARTVSPRLKRKIGDAAYMLRALRVAPKLRPQAIAWKDDGADHEDAVAMVVVSNTRLYGGRVRFSPGAFANDGLLDAVVACPHSFWDTARLGAKLVLGRIEHDRSAVQASVHELVIETPGIPYQLDGDYGGESPVTFRVDAAALLVSVPAGRLPSILSREPAHASEG